MEEMLEALYAKAAPVNASITTMHRIRAVYLIFFMFFSLYYRVVVIRVPLQGLCYTVRDAVDWLCSPTA
ncbi:MAG: hypothetical protein KHW94_09120, partial [Clostridium sp.]|nr:hypothetical protein [Clostridium sp.]